MPVHVGDIGTRIKATIVDETGSAVDVSGATLTMYLLKPKTIAGVQTTITATPTVLDATAGIVYYDTVSGDLSLMGVYAVQVKYVKSGKTFGSDLGEFAVAGNLY